MLRLVSYREDLDRSDLETQLEIFSQMEMEPAGDVLQFRDIHRHLKLLSSSQLGLISQVAKLAKLVLLMPATNAVSEQRASAMRRIKTYLRSSMTQTRLNNVMVVHVHKHLTDSVDCVKVLYEFASANEDRKTHFGKF